MWNFVSDVTEKIGDFKIELSLKKKQLAFFISEWWETAMKELLIHAEKNYSMLSIYEQTIMFSLDKNMLVFMM